MARERIAQEQEAERKRQEAENERERLRRIQELRGSPLTEASRSELFRLGDTPSNIAALQDMYQPKGKPTYEERREGGGVAIYEDGRFKSWKIRPPSERETPSGPTPADRRAAETAFGGATSDVRRMVRTQPQLSDKKYQGITSSAARDTASFLEDRARFAADTAFGMEQARMAARDPALGAQRQQEMGSLLATLSGRRPQMSPTAAAEQAEAREVQQAIARVMASSASDEEKRAAVQAINDEFQRAILEIRSGR
jgi:hypothetical protein